MIWERARNCGELATYGSNQMHDITHGTFRIAIGLYISRDFEIFPRNYRVWLYYVQSCIGAGYMILVFRTIRAVCCRHVFLHAWSVLLQVPINGVYSTADAQKGLLACFIYHVWVWVFLSVEDIGRSIESLDMWAHTNLRVFEDFQCCVNWSGSMYQPLFALIIIVIARPRMHRKGRIYLSGRTGSFGISNCTEFPRPPSAKSVVALMKLMNTGVATLEVSCI